MNNVYRLISESLQSDVPFIVHRHNPRSGSQHYDIRFLNVRNNRVLFSFAAPSNFLDTVNGKTVLVKTKDHDPRWLTLKSYRLENIDEGKATIKIQTAKYIQLTFHGEV